MVTVRPAQTADIEAIQHVARTTWHATYDDIIGSDAVDEQVDEWYADAVVRDGIIDSDTATPVATVDDTVVGYAVAGQREDADADCASLHAIYVHPDHWGAGIGSRLFETVADRLRDRDFEHLHIRVLADNDRARAFYERHGYTGTDRRQIELAGATPDEVVYEGPL